MGIGVRWEKTEIVKPRAEDALLFTNITQDHYIFRGMYRGKQDGILDVPKETAGFTALSGAAWL